MQPDPTSTPTQPPEPPQEPPSKRHIRRQLFIGFGSLALLAVIGTCIAALAGSGSTQQSASSTSPAPTYNASTPLPTATSTAQPVKATAVPARDGSCAPQPCANDNYGWIVTIGNVKYDVASGNQFIKPEAGNVFVTLDVTFTNKLDSEQHADSGQFVLQDGAGIKHTPAIMGPCDYWSAVNLTPGATLGPKCLAFQASAGNPSGLKLVWTPTGFGGGYTMKLS